MRRLCVRLRTPSLAIPVRAVVDLATLDIIGCTNLTVKDAPTMTGTPFASPTQAKRLWERQLTFLSTLLAIGDTQWSQNASQDLSSE